MEEFCRSAMKQLGDSVLTDIQRIDTTSQSYFSESPDIVGEFSVSIIIINSPYISFQFLKQDSDQPHIVTSACGPDRMEFVIFSSDEFSSNSDEQLRRTMMSEVLDYLIMTPSLGRRIMDMALHKTHGHIASRPPNHNCISIQIFVDVCFKFDFDERPILDDEDELLNDVKGYTVPAIDAETCAICLTDFLNDGSKYVFTPCGHKFHVDCINEWLRVKCSHHRLPCPVCRHNFDRFAVTTS